MSRYNAMRSGETIDKVIDSISGGIQFVYVDSLSGTLDADSLKTLTANKVNRMVYDDTIYYLSILDGNVRKYFSKIQSSVYNEIDVDTTTGAYEVISKADPLVTNHIENSDIHVTASEKSSWDDKVYATVELVSGSDYQLVLSNVDED